MKPLIFYVDSTNEELNYNSDNIVKNSLFIGFACYGFEYLNKCLQDNFGDAALDSTIPCNEHPPL